MGRLNLLLPDRPHRSLGRFGEQGRQSSYEPETKNRACNKLMKDAGKSRNPVSDPAANVKVFTKRHGLCWTLLWQMLLRLIRFVWPCCPWQVTSPPISNTPQLTDVVIRHLANEAPRPKHKRFLRTLVIKRELRWGAVEVRSTWATRSPETALCALERWIHFFFLMGLDSSCESPNLQF